MTDEEKVIEGLKNHIMDVRRFRALLIGAGFDGATPIDTTIAYLEMYRGLLETLIEESKKNK